MPENRLTSRPMLRARRGQHAKIDEVQLGGLNHQAQTLSRIGNKMTNLEEKEGIMYRDLNALISNVIQSLSPNLDSNPLFKTQKDIVNVPYFEEEKSMPTHAFSLTKPVSVIEEGYFNAISDIASESILQQKLMGGGMFSKLKDASTLDEFKELWVLLSEVFDSNVDTNFVMSQN